MEQVMALENEGDDFITKPIHSEVEMAKNRRQLRRAYGDYATQSVERIVEQHGLQLFPERHELKYGTTITTLTSKETDIIERLLDRDRKSTRLNSSHVAISYAVFCLKKKNNSILEIL